MTRGVAQLVHRGRDRARAGPAEPRPENDVCIGRLLRFGASKRFEEPVELVLREHVDALC